MSITVLLSLYWKTLDDRMMSDDGLELLVPWNEIVKAEIERRKTNQNHHMWNCRRVLRLLKSNGDGHIFLKIVLSLSMPPLFLCDLKVFIPLLSHHKDNG